MTQQEAIRKAMACLRLAKSSNPNEAALAAAKAQEIIDRHQLDVTGLDYDAQQRVHDDEPIVNFDNDALAAEISYFERVWTLRLASKIAKVNGCRVYYRSYGSHGAPKADIKIIGRPSDVETVRYLFSWLKHETARLKAENCRGSSPQFKTQFCVGVVDTISRKLDEQREQTIAAVKAEQANNSLALVRVQNAVMKMESRGTDVEKFMGEKMKLRTVRGRGGFGGSDSNGATARGLGRKAGERINLNGARAGIGRGVAGQLQ